MCFANEWGERNEDMNLMEGIMLELARNREALKVYESLPAGAFASAMIKRTIARAEKAIAGGDVIEMMKVYEELKETKL